MVFEKRIPDWRQESKGELLRNEELSGLRLTVLYYVIECIMNTL